MKATFDGYLYVAENGADSDDGYYWFSPDSTPAKPHYPQMPAEVEMIGGPLDGQTVKRKMLYPDAVDYVDAFFVANHATIRADLDRDHTSTGRDIVTAKVAEVAMRKMSEALQCVTLDPIIFATRKAVASFCHEYYSGFRGR